MASNLLDLIHLDLPMLVLYGTDHVTARARTDGGQKRDQPFLAMALRIRQAGVKIFLVVTIPLAGASSWRGDPKRGRMDRGGWAPVIGADVRGLVKCGVEGPVRLRGRARGAGADAD